MLPVLAAWQELERRPGLLVAVVLEPRRSATVCCEKMLGPGLVRLLRGLLRAAGGMAGMWRLLLAAARLLRRMAVWPGPGRLLLEAGGGAGVWVAATGC